MDLPGTGLNCLIEETTWEILKLYQTIVRRVRRILEKARVYYFCFCIYNIIVMFIKNFR